MKLAKRMCESCPWRVAKEPGDPALAASIPAEDFSCHEQEFFNRTVQCRGHYENVRKHNKTKSP